MGTKSLRRGKSFEYRIRNWFIKKGFKAERVPVSGNSRFQKGDIVVEINQDLNLVVECKRRTDAYKELFKWIEEMKKNRADVLVLGVGRQKPLVIMEIDAFLEMVKRIKA